MDQQQARLDFVRVVHAINVDTYSLLHKSCLVFDDEFYERNCGKVSMPVRNESQSDPLAIIPPTKRPARPCGPEGGFHQVETGRADRDWRKNEFLRRRFGVRKAVPP